jgi:DNA segregation ATPase FtsK/SpoIIIE, S-DNA-T family
VARHKNRKKFKDDESKPERRKWHADLKPETKQSVWAILSFLFAVLFFLAWLGKAGLVGSSLYSAFDFLFGKAFLLIPTMFLLTGLSFFYNLRERIFAGTFFGGILFLVGALGLADVFFGFETGGAVGMLIAYLPLTYLDKIASGILFSAIMLISMLLILNIPISMQFFRRREEEPMSNQPLTVVPEVLETSGGVLSGVRNAVSGLSSVLDKKQDTHSTSAEEDDGKEQIHKPVRHLSPNYKLPALSLLEDDRGKPTSGDIKANANIIQRTLQNFGIEVDMGEISIGPSVTQYTLKPAEGIKLSRITNLSANLELALSAPQIRIEAPIPGRSLVGIQVPNKTKSFVGLRTLMAELNNKEGFSNLGFALGRDVTGIPVFADLTRMPHVLIAGTTGSGKSVAIHSILMGLLFRNSPETLRLVLIDPKRLEMMVYQDIPHLHVPVIVEAKQAVQGLRGAVREMERRLQVLQNARVRDIAAYNVEHPEEIMPYMVIVIDELAELMSVYPREIEASIVRLAQLARAVGIHLVVSTQRPSVEVITGLIKANISTRVALKLPSQIDSRTILDMAGAEKLLGNGDMLYISVDMGNPKRIQGGFVSDGEVKKVVNYIRTQGEASYDESLLAPDGKTGGGGGSFGSDDDVDDELYEQVRQAVIEANKASASYLQRRFRVGYARAARLIDMLEEKGVIGPGDGAKPREILLRKEDDSSENYV